MKQVIVLFGPPGAGKGTQAELLSSRLGLTHFETSKILEDQFKKAENFSDEERFVQVGEKKYDMLDEKKLWDEGVLCSPPFVVYLVKKKIKELSDSGESLVLSGSPRTLLEAEQVAPLLKELYKEDIRAFFIEINPDETIFRNSHRKVCELMRHSILYSEENEKLTTCPLDGSKLIKRELDDPETIKIRLEEYKKRTFPVVEHLEKEGIEVKKINGEQSVANVFKDILKELRT